MNMSEKALVRTVAFLISAAVSASSFGLFSSWVWNELDPTQQAAIASINTPLIPNRGDRERVASAPAAVRVDKPSDYEPLRLASPTGAEPKEGDMPIFAKKFLVKMKRMVSVSAIALTAKSGMNEPADVFSAPSLPVSTLNAPKKPVLPLLGDSK